MMCSPIVVGLKAGSIVLCVPAGKAESLSVMKLFVRCAISMIAVLVLAGCKTVSGPQKLGGGINSPAPDMSWKRDLASGVFSERMEPATPSWFNRSVPEKQAVARARTRISSIRQMASRLAPAGFNVSTLSSMVGKRRQARIGCIPADLKMLLNTVAWHYGKKVHIQSGYRSRRHNRRVGGAKHSYHLKCQAVDIQVSGVNKYTLARYLKSLPGRGGVGTYCNVSTVHIDVGPKRSWHYGCRWKSRKRYASRTK